jgi:glucose-6-phosphate isomerase
MKQIRFDFNNMFDSGVGKRDGVTMGDIKAMRGAVSRAAGHLDKVLASEASRINIGLEWTRLPLQNKKLISMIQAAGEAISGKYENVISLGIGGSYLGLKAAQDALASPYYNEFAAQRKGCAKVYFDGNNLDPDTLSALLKNLSPKKTFVIVISKSGETSETKAAFAVVEAWLRRGAGKRYGKMDEMMAKGLTADECADRIIRAILAEKEEVIIGKGLVKYTAYVRRFFPRIYSRLIRKVKVT